MRNGRHAAIAILAALTAIAASAQDEEVRHKISPGLRAAAAQAQRLDVMIVLTDQPHPEILRRAHEDGAGRLGAAQDNYRRLATRTAVSQTELAQAGSEIDAAILAIRRDAAARLRSAIGAGQDAFIRSIAGLGAANIRRFTAINMVGADIPATLLDVLESDPGVAAVFPVETPHPALDISVPALGAPSFWATGNSGAGQQVAVLDTGVRTNHPAFRGLTIESYPFVAGAQAQAPSRGCIADNINSGEDSHGHGTHVAGIIAAGGAGTTRIGVAPGISKLINLKIALNQSAACNNGTTGAYASTADVMQAVDWALANTAATIFNYSWGLGAGDDSYFTRVFDFFADHFNVTFVVAAGNNGAAGASTVEMPSVGYNVISVANVADNATVTRADDAISPSSGRGPTVAVAGFPLGRRKPDIAAPGSGVIGAAGTGIFSANYNWDAPLNALFISKTGTSMAAPHIAGAVALLQNRPEANPVADGCPAGVTAKRPLAIKSLLLNSASALAPTPAGMKRGWDAAAGWGYADLSRAIRMLHVYSSCVASDPSPEHVRYYAGAAVLPANEMLRATLTWDRHVNWQRALGAATPLTESRLTLFLYEYDAVSNQPVSPTPAQALQDDARNTVRQVTTAINGSYVVKVRGESGYDPTIASEPFALAISQSGFRRARGPALTIDCKTTPAGAAAPGANVAVACTVRNTGDLPAFNLVIGTSLTGAAGDKTWREALPGAASTYSWQVTIPANATGEVPYTARVGADAYGERLNVLMGFAIPVETPLTIRCGARASTVQPGGGAFQVSCSVTNSGDVPAMNTMISLSAGGPVASQSIGKFEKGSNAVTFDPIPAIYSQMTGSVRWTASGQTFTVATNVAIDQCQSKFSFTPASVTVPVSGVSSAVVIVTAPSGCAWTATNSTINPDIDEWIQFTGGASGVGSGVIHYLVLPNGGSIRSGSIGAGWARLIITQNGTAQRPTFTVSGRVTAPDGSGIYGVRIAGAATDVNGNWSQDLASGRAYLIAPSKPGYNFTPAYRTVSSAASGLNFVGSFSFAASGRIVSSNGTPIAGATLNFTRQAGSGTLPAPVSTDAQGQWRQAGFQTGTTYLVTPTLANYGFSPASRTVSDGAVAIDFTGSRVAGASGRVITASGGGIPGVTLTFALVAGASGAPAAVQTDAQGNYAQTGFAADALYTITPSKPGLTFSPQSRAFTGGGTNLNFTGSSVPFAVSGQIADAAGTGTAGVTLIFVRLTGTGGAPAAVQSDAQGRFTQSGFDTGASYRVTASKAGVTFSPASRDFSGASSLNFVAQTMLSVSGKIVDGSGAALPGVTLTFAPVNNSATAPPAVVTDAQGNWAQTGFAPGVTWLVTPSKPGYVFTPPSATFTNGVPTLTFSARPLITVTGTVVNANGVAVAGANLTFAQANGGAPAPAQTDSSGHWSQSGFLGGATYTVSYGLAGVAFAPASASFTAGAAPVALSVTATFAASGIVTATLGNGFPGVSIVFSGGSTTPAAVVTDVNGAWSQSGFLLGTAYRVSPVKALCAINPAYLSFSGPATGLNFNIPVCGR